MRKLLSLYWIDRMLLACLLAALAGCGGSASSDRHAAPDLITKETVLPAAGLPSIHDEQPVPRAAAYVRQIHSDGFAIFNSHPDTFTSGTHLVIPSTATSPGWARYAYNPDGYQPTRLQVGIETGGNGTAFIGISDYALDTWRFFGPFTDDADINLPPSQYLSSLGQAYVAVISHSGTSVTSKYVILHYDNGSNTDFSVSGTVLDENGDPVPGIQLEITPGFEQVVTGLNGSYFVALPAADTYTVTPQDFSGKWSFNPTDQLVVVNTNVIDVDFTGTRIDVRGTITDGSGAGIPGVMMTLLPGGATTSTGADGSYEFTGVADGAHTVQPLLGGYTFTPTEQMVTVAGADENAVDFSGEGGQPTYSISGTILEGGSGLEGVTVVLNPGFRIATTNALGFYSFSGLPDALYTIEPNKGLYTFTPPAKNALIDGANLPNQDFSATPPPPLRLVAGMVTDPGPGLLVPDASVTCIETGQTVKTDDNGIYEFMLPDGNYTLSASKHARTVVGGSKNISVAGSDVTVPDFELADTFSPTWENFTSIVIGNHCTHCHRPDSIDAVDPPLRNYAETVAAGAACNNRIQNGTMPPGNPLHEYDKHYFAKWRMDGSPED